MAAAIRSRRKPDDPVVAGPTIAAVRRAAKICTACHLYKLGTQTVFGEGPQSATVMLIGEQPGDAEDLAGKPFVGPAGPLLDKALAETGIDRDAVYVTNAVKHFKWIARGKKRIHKKPNMLEIEACRPWLDAEIERVAPDVIVALGATAAQALFGRSFRVTRQRGKPVSSDLARTALATVHPSSILRAPDPAARDQAYADFVRDLRVVARAMRSGSRRKAAE